jgi:hypothetical protein
MNGSLPHSTPNGKIAKDMAYSNVLWGFGATPHKQSFILCILSIHVQLDKHGWTGYTGFYGYPARRQDGDCLLPHDSTLYSKTQMPQPTLSERGRSYLI